ncbi:tRNA wybutosine-synthesizing protein-like protein [Hapsidospora chrysogenum ATCC 11550]|uniref:tRNA(Phe) 7-[(3-amino-3-carboxypropyl)-4-demethylwyosine(37)-N(4)]-methyltransferase n=1 Tax=Hapsidospora chrysogenum (strain ATCC 11550 / CBS 779.69 / DSM 880 / IAM 14645 / JCM 23072 / IMI 49137) TaxID=857340 RepID=A0A086T0K9_HAPC1|nr:tRNA wybutosine-synthesizing protein-like protein [Hapsidospora chrysogenum ATCC 11550]
MQGLPPPAGHFAARKAKILNQLSVPDAEYSDASPKGSIDDGIRDLIDEINALDGLVTTSSCAGRVSVFVEGKKTAEAGDHGQLAGVGGKGAGGAWLFVSHEPVSNTASWISSLGLREPEVGETGDGTPKDRRLIHFKFEPMILHVLTASPAHAQLILRCGLQAGFRESGAVNLTTTSSDSEQSTPMVAIRSMGLGFESLIGYQKESRREQLVTAEYLRSLMEIANERFTENTKRIDRFQEALADVARTQPTRKNAAGEEWEDAAVRRERKRAEGLRRKAELLQKETKGTVAAEPETLADGLSGF